MKFYDIALTFVPRIGIKGAKHLLECFGSAEAIFAASREELADRALITNPTIIDALLSKEPLRNAEQELLRAERAGIIPVASTDAAYPATLRECPDSPHVIYVMGNLETLHRPSVAFVGTRHISAYGQRMGARLVMQLHELAPDAAVVSGLALGNDANAHIAALDCGAPTIGVIANALPDIAPATNQPLAERILRNGGAVVTEITSQHKNTGKFFPSRNRIIAGLASGTVVVESPTKGGSLITAEMAFDYGRVVMAAPGRADDLNSQGSNALIKHNKAAMVCCGHDIVYELGWDIGTTHKEPIVPQPQPVVWAHLSPEEQQLLSVMKVGEVVDYDILSQRTGLSIAVVAALMVSLELDGAVRLLAGKRCERI